MSGARRKLTSRLKTRLATAALAATTVVALAGCGVGIQDLPLSESGGIDVTAELTSADGVVIGADVRSGQRVIGRVTELGLRDDHAELTLSLDGDVQLPANTSATVELPSVLGNPFIRLTAPEKPTGTLTDGAHLTLEQTSVGPQLENTLAAVGNLLNGSGMVQLQSVMTSLNNAFATRSTKVADLIATLNRLLAKSSRYTDDFNAAIAAAADVSQVMTAQRSLVNDFLTQVPAAVNVLAGQRDRIASLMTQTTLLARNVDVVVRGRQAQLNALVGDTRTTLDALASFNSNVGTTLGHMNSFITNFNRAVRGDYLVFDGALDIPGGIDKILTGGLLLSGQPLPTVGDLADVLTGRLPHAKSESSKRHRAPATTRQPR